MNEANAGKLDTAAAPAAPNEAPEGGRLRVWVNWVLALLTVPAAAVVLVFALGAVMSTAGCSPGQCPNLGPGGISFGVLFYGAPIVAALAIVLSVFTARRRWGIAVPLCALALLVADIVIVAVTVVQ
ncbi:hypothetical protein [Mycobacterium shimoidei]|uniref:Uncharacterized protein n=1 Tax=Mycobacterium shimoidei TaxID=29313 RepID=A0A1E3TCS2_MYCSH|nr:hypothetical protein [Mycobacterium shimoidei]MCV7259650.1 hypothetical protein [Mycobacterium shimoidei]ODR12222.1 hypothetical protein BHQ16_16880 [Mycobacterium shimoidei]ORW77056.1 hypothetical protein AWC26_20035 [Mycobacterium shimoidei]SRX93169.1 hypothetical protein MSP7336_01404 [Mycobacterium shimoidei]